MTKTEINKYHRNYYHKNKSRCEKWRKTFLLKNPTYKPNYYKTVTRRNPKALQALYDSCKRNKLAKKMIIWSIKASNPCQDCHEYYKPWVMEFDHLPGLHKRINLSVALSKGYDTIYNEICKCQVVCANCHKERTHFRATGKYS